MPRKKEDPKANAEDTGVATTEAAPPATRPPTVPVIAGERGLELRSLDEMRRYAQYVAESVFCPKDMRGKVGDVMCCLQFGAEVGLAPMQSIQNIAVINGRPSLWGDALLGLVIQSGLLDSIKETFSGKQFEDDYGWTCTVKRKGVEDPVVRSFTVADAKRAKKWATDGPWTTYPDRLLMFRARGFALRDMFADVLKGLIAREEAMDLPPEMVHVENEAERPKTITALADKLKAEDEAATEVPVEGEPANEGGDDDGERVENQEEIEDTNNNATSQPKGGDTDEGQTQTAGSDTKDEGAARSDAEAPVKGGDANTELF